MSEWSRREGESLRRASIEFAADAATPTEPGKGECHLRSGNRRVRTLLAEHMLAYQLGPAFLFEQKGEDKMNQITVGGRVLSGGQPALQGSYAEFLSLTGTQVGRGVHATTTPLNIVRLPRPQCFVDSDGYFAVQVSLQTFTDALEAGASLRYQVRAQLCTGQSPAPGLLDRVRGIDRGTITYGAVRRRQGPLVRVVSLRAIADGNIPDPRDLGSFTGDVARTYSEVRQLARRLPTFGVSVPPPSTDFYAFFGHAVFNFT